MVISRRSMLTLAQVRLRSSPRRHPVSIAAMMSRWRCRAPLRAGRPPHRAPGVDAAARASRAGWYRSPRSAAGQIALAHRPPEHPGCRLHVLVARAGGLPRRPEFREERFDRVLGERCLAQAVVLEQLLQAALIVGAERLPQAFGIPLAEDSRRQDVRCSRKGHYRGLLIAPRALKLKCQGCLHFDHDRRAQLHTFRRPLFGCLFAIPVSSLVRLLAGLEHRPPLAEELALGWCFRDAPILPRRGMLVSLVPVHRSSSPRP